MQALQRAGVVLRVKDKVFLHPDRVVRTALLKIEDQCDVAAGRPTARERLKALVRSSSALPIYSARRTGTAAAALTRPEDLFSARAWGLR